MNQKLTGSVPAAYTAHYKSMRQMHRALFLGIMGTLVRDSLPTLGELLGDGLSAASSLACLPPFPPEALCPSLVPLQPTHTNHYHRTEHIV